MIPQNPQLLVSPETIAVCVENSSRDILNLEARDGAQDALRCAIENFYLSRAAIIVTVPQEKQSAVLDRLEKRFTQRIQALCAGDSGANTWHPQK
ncbi:MAG: hypothetical protein RDV41_02985 [Planctomycetota bacterium]|nr:hypothetical protein [Planctomycetota bacterium]